MPYGYNLFGGLRDLSKSRPVSPTTDSENDFLDGSPSRFAPSPTPWDTPSVTRGAREHVPHGRSRRDHKPSTDKGRQRLVGSGGWDPVVPVSVPPASSSTRCPARELINGLTGEVCQLSRKDAFRRDRAEIDYNVYYRNVYSHPRAEERPTFGRVSYDGPPKASAVCDRDFSPNRRGSDHRVEVRSSLAGGFQPSSRERRSDSRRGSDFGMTDLSLADGSYKPSSRRHGSRSSRPDKQ